MDTTRGDRRSLGFALLIGVTMWAVSAYHTLKFGDDLGKRVGWSWFGVVGTWAYLPFCIVGAFVLLKLRNWLAGAPKAINWSLFGLVAAMVLTLVFVVYPKANVHQPDRGSDRDDALDTGATAILRGQYPYQFRTYQGSPISPMPGALMLAIPWVLIGGSAYQVFLWLGAFAGTAYALCRRMAEVAVLMLMLVPLWITELQELATGGDYNLNAIYVLCASLWLLLACNRKWWIAVPLAVLVGMTLSSRSNYLITTPALFAAMCVLAGWRRAVVLSAIAGGTFLAVTLPFYLHDPAQFGPKIQDKFADLQVPFITAPAMAAISAIAAAGFMVAILRKRTSPLSGYLWAFYVGNLLPVAAASIAHWIYHHEPNTFIRWASMVVPGLLLLSILPRDAAVRNNSPSQPAASMA